MATVYLFKLLCSLNCSVAYFKGFRFKNLNFFLNLFAFFQKQYSLINSYKEPYEIMCFKNLDSVDFVAASVVLLNKP